jgi:hypothetical protein
VGGLVELVELVEVETDQMVVPLFFLRLARLIQAAVVVVNGVVEMEQMVVQEL